MRTLLLLGPALPSRLQREYSQARTAQLRRLDAALNITYLAVLSMYAMTQGKESWLVRVFTAHHMIFLALTMWLQVGGDAAPSWDRHMLPSVAAGQLYARA